MYLLHLAGPAFALERIVMGRLLRIVLLAGILTLRIRYLLVLNKRGKMLLLLRENYC